MTLLLILQSALFGLWTIQMFVSLFRLRARAAAELGVMFPGPLRTLRYWGIWLRDPATRGERLRLLVLTLALFGTILVQIASRQAAA